MDNTWKVIEEFPDYEINEIGEVRSWKPIRNYGKIPEQARIVKSRLDRDGYLKVAIYRDNKRHDRHIHRLVCITFNGIPDKGQQVRHMDGNKLNNHKNNLSWGTAKENSNDKILHGTQINGERVNTSKLKIDEIISIRNSTLKSKEIAKNFNVSISLIYKIRSKEIWKHV